MKLRSMRVRFMNQVRPPMNGVFVDVRVWGIVFRFFDGGKKNPQKSEEKGG
jgi:hypothetical protein